MPLNRETLGLIRDVLEAEYVGVTGPKPFRFFTPDDCRHYAAAKDIDSVDRLAEAIEAVGLATVGELVAREEAFSERHSCPRCDFAHSVDGVVLAAERLGYDNLSDTERGVVDACQSWVTEDTIHAILDQHDL